MNLTFTNMPPLILIEFHGGILDGTVMDADGSDEGQLFETMMLAFGCLSTLGCKPHATELMYYNKPSPQTIARSVKDNWSKLQKQVMMVYHVYAATRCEYQEDVLLIHFYFKEYSY